MTDNTNVVNRSARLHVRVRPHERERIREAARLARTRPLEFCRDAVLAATKRVLAGTADVDTGDDAA